MKKICSIALIISFLTSYIIPPASFAAESSNYRMATFATTSAGGESAEASSHRLINNTVGEAVNGDLESSNIAASTGYLNAITREGTQPGSPPAGTDRLAESANFKVISYLLSMGSGDPAGFVSNNFKISLAAVGEPLGGISEGNYNKSFGGHIYTILNNPPVLNKSIPTVTFPINSSKESAFDLDDYFTEPDGEALTFSAKGNLNIVVSIDPVTHLVSFSQLTGFVGTEDITIIAADPEGNKTESNVITLYVYNTGGINNAPALNFITDIIAKEGESIAIAPSAIDPDGDTLTYSFTLPKFDSQGKWQSGYNDAGTYNVTVIVSDGYLTDSREVRVTVLNVNRPPRLDLINEISVNEGQLAAIAPTATDPDNDALTYTFSSPFNYEGKWRTAYRDAGVHNVTVTVSDGELSDSQDVIVNVINVNTAPTVNISLSRINVSVNENFSFIVNADDADCDPLTLALYKDSETQPFFSGGVYDYYVGTASFSSLGVHKIKAIVTDGQGGSAETTVNLEVIDPPSLWGKILPLLGDFNGDGLVDIGTYNKDSGRWAVSLSNFDGFGSLNEWLTEFGNGTNYQYVNGDFNGDGLTDIAVYNQNNGVWQIKFSERTRFGTDTISKSLSASSSFVPITGDFNGDGLSDIGVYDRSHGNITIALSEKTAFSQSADWLTGFSYSGSTQPFTGDFNADGLTDFGVFNDGSWNFAISDGTKFITQGGWNISGFGSAKSPVISDFNNDGLTDIGIFDKADGSWSIRYCNGRGFEAAPRAWLSNFGKSDYNTPYALDFSGDGLTDAAFFDNSNFTWQRLTAAGTVADLLSKITNNLGGTTEITYKSSVYYDNTGGDGICDLPFGIQTVSAVKQGDGLGHFYYSNYSYANGLFSPEERETRGFGYVKVKDVENNVSESWFKQDNIFKGLPYQERASDSQGKIYLKSVKTYNYSTSYTGCNFPYLAEEESYVYEGQVSAKTTKTAYEYDNYGNAAKIVSFGDLDVTGDEKEANIEYVYNTTAWILGLPAHSYLKNASGQIVSESWLYYDGHQNPSDIPVKGNLTKEEKRLDPKPAGITDNPATTMSYDNYGNLLSATDARGNTTTTTYDAVYHAFPETVTNSYPFELNQTTTYDAKTGQVLTATDINGQTSRNEYDIFGRVIKKFGPNDDAAHPLEWSEYDFSVLPAKIKTCVREEHNTDDPNKIRTSYSFFDGLGRLIELKSEAEDDTKQIVSEIAAYNIRGLVEQKFFSYLVDKTTEYTDPLSLLGRGQGEGAKHSTYEYDALGRLVKTTNPDGTISRAEYQQWAAAATDENGHKLRKVNDAYGRIVKVEEFNHGEVYTTTYIYDTLGNLTSITDNQGNTSTISYDSLSRKISMVDPDMGNWTYEYDAVGNLKKQTDAKGQILKFEYDQLNRLIQKEGLSPQGTVPVTLAIYAYDDPNVPYSKGRLTKVSDQSGTTEFFYDNLGREIKSIKTVKGLSPQGTVPDTQYTIERAYDAVGRLKSLKYPDGEIVNYTYNKSGGIEKVEGLSPQGTVPYVTNVDYNEFGQMRLVNYGNTTHTDYAYNPSTLRLERLTTNDGALQDLEYEFDNVGNIRTITDSRNTGTQSFAYDDLNRLTSASGQTYGTKYYRYDSIGNMLEKEGVKYRYGENGAGPHALTSGDNGLNLAYDANGNMLSKGAQNLEYDVENRLIKSSKPGEENNFTSVNITLSPGWNFVSVPLIPQRTVNDPPDSRVGAAFSSIQFGADYDQVSKYSPFKPGFESYNNSVYSQFDSVEYGKGYIVYVTNSNNVTLTLSGRQPDTIKQVPLKTGWNLIGTPSITAVKASDGLLPLIYNTDYDRIVKYNSLTDSYEDITINDNLEPGKAYYIRALKDTTWQINPGYESTEFVYDGDGGRVKKISSPRGGEGQGEGAISTTYIGSLYEVEGSVAAGFSLRKHIFMGSQRIATISLSQGGEGQGEGAISYYHSDHLGSSNLITDSTGNQVGLTEFTPYGSVIKQTGTYDPKYKFTGKELDNTGLYFYGARYYDPEIGRFIQADTIVQSPYNPQTLNRYTYCNNNPINYVDPSGHGWFKKFLGQIVGAIVGVVTFIAAGGPANPAAFPLAMAAYGFTSGSISAYQQGYSVAQSIGIGIGVGTAAYLGGALGAQYAAWIGGGQFGATVLGGTFAGSAGGATNSALTGGDVGQGAAQGAIGGFISGSMMGGMNHQTSRDITSRRYAQEMKVRHALNVNQKDTNVRMIQRPLSRNMAGDPGSTTGPRHRAVIWDILPDGSWEMGPENGLLQTTNSAENLSRWGTHLATEKSLALGGRYIESFNIQVNGAALQENIALYEATFAGKFSYNALSHNSNFAVNSVIYGAGGDVPFRGWAPGYPDAP